MTLKEALNNPKINRDEVSLFKEMIRYFQTNYSSVVIDQTHKHSVSFNAVKPYENWGKVTKEISDVFFVVFSQKREIARMTHLQAKFKKGQFNRAQTPQFKFHLDAGQYHMLSNRLSIDDPQGVYPWDILSHLVYSDSVASYGVFYPNESNQIEMAYELASLLGSGSRKPFARKDDKPLYQFATLETNYGYVNKNIALLNQKLPKDFKEWMCYYSCVIRHEHYYELLSTLDTNTFEQELIDLHVGTRFDFNTNHITQLCRFFEAQQTKNNVVVKFRKFTEEILKYNENFYPKFAEYIDHFNDNYPPRQEQRFNNVEGEGGVYILIDADERKE